jgi:hypothetical protein
MDTQAIPISIRPYLIEIAERLWTGHASVMIGAGFSKNAINKVGDLKGMPNWNELGDIFYKKIHGEAPGSKSKYLNALRLADEVQASFGRSVLDQILKKHIPDKDYEPSDIHIKLLELPWSDVFTTNYDTLLERSCENVISRRYDIVVNQNDIIYSKSPRIIKLHGSFPSERPLIITEEDYRIYPKRFAPFVNTVQQSLLENTLCLIGFSGDDPNFLQWIGWINDNIGKENSPKIYLIGVLNLSQAQKKLLATKNIVPVDLSELLTEELEHKKAIDLLLNFLFNQKTSRKNLEWGISQRYISSNNVSIAEVAELWKAERLGYPNWIICPQENREGIWAATDQYLNNESIWEGLESPQDIDFIFELNWRFERCLFPLYNNHVTHFETTLSKYNPFPDDLQTTALLQPDLVNSLSLNWSEIRTKWVHISLSLLRFYREEGFYEKWELNKNTLHRIKRHLTSEHRAWYQYEMILFAIFNSDIERAKTLLQDWPANEYDPFWDAKRGLLLAEFGFSGESLIILEKCLTTVRKQLNLTPVVNDYRLLSLEAYLMLQFRLVRSNFRVSKGLYNIDDDNDVFNERWNILLQFKCAPWQEKKHFDTILQHKYNPITSKSTKDNFQIGARSTSYRLGARDSEVVVAYNFLRFVEELGAPLSMRITNFDDSTIKGALERISQISPKWALAVFNRSRVIELANIVFNRLSLSKLNYKIVDELALEYISKFKVLLENGKDAEFVNFFLKKIPTALSHLCVKCSENVQAEIYKFYVEIIESNGDLSQIDHLWLMLRESSSDDLKMEMIPILLRVPLIDESSRSLNSTFAEPFEHFNIQFVAPFTNEKEIIDGLFKSASTTGSIRSRALTRLFFLHKHKLLDEKQVNRLFSVLWAVRDENGFPKDHNFYYRAYIELPHPQNEDVTALFKQYIFENDFHVQGTNSSIGLGQMGDRYAEELWYGSANVNNSDGIWWTSGELSQIIDKCLNWWDSDKKYLIEERYKDDAFGGSIYKEFLGRFKLLANILARVIAFQCKGLTQDDLIKVVDLILDMESNGAPVMKAKIAFAEHIGYSESDFLTALEVKMIENTQPDITEAFEVAIIALLYYDQNLNQEAVQKLLDIISQPLKWRNVDLTADCLLTIENIIAHKNELYQYLKPVLDSSLNYLFGYTDITKLNNDNEGNVGQMLLIRQRAIKLANTIKNIDSDTSEVISKWRLIAEDPNEFGDIKRYWQSEITAEVL